MFTTNRNALFSSALPWLVGKIARGKTVNSGHRNALLAPAQYTNLVFLSVATALFPMSYVCRASVLDQDGGHSLVQYFDLPHLTVDSVIIVTASAQSCFSQAATAVAPNHSLPWANVAHTICLCFNYTQHVVTS